MSKKRRGIDATDGGGSQASSSTRKDKGLSVDFKEPQVADFENLEEDFEDQGSELSWLTVGFRISMGISLGICLGVGIGVGLLARSYQSTSRSLKRWLISSLL